MNAPLKLLIVEDSPEDAELVVAELLHAGFDLKWTRVETESDFLVELGKIPDIILSDHAMPMFSGLRAAQLTQESKLDIPFILVSGMVGEDAAVEAMKLGATDYLLKDRIARLGSAVESALEQKRLRSERQREQKELIWKTAFLEAQVDSAPDGILVVDDRAKRILQNRRLFELFKVPEHIVHDDDDGVLLQYVIDRAKNPMQFSERVAYLYAHPDEIGRDEIELVDGTTLDRYSAPVRDKAGKYYGRIWTFRDITEQRKLEEQFRHTQKMKAIGQMAGGVAHDFNNILSVIQMQASLLETTGNLSPIQLDYCKEIGKSTERATNLTRQLLLFSRKQALQPRDHDLNTLVINIAKMLRHLLSEDVDLQFNYFPEPLLIHADAGMMDQIVINLAVNSRDAMPGGGQLVINTSRVEFDEDTAAQSPQARPGSFACLSVSDTGCGIPPEILPKIFEPFFTTKDAGKGTGLGLATIFGIVQQHHGWVTVHSNVGHGTNFRVYIPLLAKTTRPPVASSPVAGTRGGSETILLVEDDASVCALVQKVLTRLGYRVLEAPTISSALENWEQHHDEIQLLLTDMMIPGGMNGKELAEKFRRENSKLKVIYTSGYGADIIGKDFLMEGGINYLAKPYEAHKLAETVRNCLDMNLSGSLPGLSGL